MKKICAALFGLLCLTPSALSAKGLRLYSEIEKDWNVTYSDGRPRLEGLFSKLKNLNVIGAAPDAGQVTGGGWGDDDETPTTPAAPKTTVVLPLHSFVGSDYQKLLQTSSDLAILQMKIDDFIGFGPEGDQTALDPVKAQAIINDMKQAIEVERAVIALGLYLQSPNLAGKCRNTDDMKALLATLKGRQDFTEFGGSWTSYKRTVTEGLGSVLAGIPSSICSLRTVVNKAQTDLWLSQAIDAAVDATMQRHLSEYSSIIQGNRDSLGTTWEDSATDVSLRPLFSVQRGFQNAIDILNLVQKDLNGLTKELDLLNARSASLKNSRPLSIDTAEADLNVFRGEVSRFMLLLKSLPASPGLASLTSCQSINPSGSFLALQKPMQDCLGQLISTYRSSVTTAKTPDPASDAFARLLSQIMSKHLNLWE